jgi:hypothetical protein
MGKNSRERHRAKQKAAAQAKRGPKPVDASGSGTAPASACGDDPNVAAGDTRVAASRGEAGASGGGCDTSIGFGARDIPSQCRIIANTISEAIGARQRRRAGEAKRCRDLLTEGAGGMGGVQLVNRALFAVLLEEVRQAWERGWQPAELARVARREHTARHGQQMVDAIAAQMSLYATATVDPRWQAQLRLLGASVWWDRDDHYVDVWGERHRVDRATAIDHLLDLLYLLEVLPPIEPTGPIPGSARVQQTTSSGAAGVDQRMLDRVRALLAKAESTDYPEEAETYTAKAQQLMARYSIDQALLAAGTGGGEGPVTRRVGVDGPYEGPKSLLLKVVADANRCRTVWHKRFGFTTVVGFRADLDSTEMLFTSLLVQATRAMTALKPRPDRYGRNIVRSFRQSFLTAYAVRIGERLNAATEETDREMAASVGGQNLLPMLAARSDAVDDAFTKQFPDLVQHSMSISNREGWASGRAAADRVLLEGRPPVSS